MKDHVIELIRSRKARIGVVGLGYVGLPLVLRFGEEHFSVLGFDVDPEKVRRLTAGESYIRHIPAEKIKALVAAKQFEASSDFSRLKEADCIIICVPTPLTEKKDPDLQYIEKTADSIAATIRKGQLISLESTTYPEQQRRSCWNDSARRAWRLEKITFSSSHRNAKIPATRSFRRAQFRKSWVE